MTTLERPIAGRLDFDLPADLEAHEPPEARALARDEVRLLVSYRDTDRLVDAIFLDLPWFLDPGDLVVVNDSETLPAALSGLRSDGSEVALHLSTRLPSGEWAVEARGTRLEPGETLRLPGLASALIVRAHHGSGRLAVARLNLPASPTSYLRRWGKPIAYGYVEREWPLEAYQTVYAHRPGSAEMPSAGRPFSGRVLEQLRRRDIEVAAITLHTGVASLEAHEAPYEEWFEVTAAAVDAVRAARARGCRVVAVGTTVVRALESAVDEAGTLHAASGWTDLVVAPGPPIWSVDALLTGFHEPRASHLQLLEALADRSHLELVYRHALAERYLWHEFGDVHLLL